MGFFWPCICCCWLFLLTSLFDCMLCVFSVCVFVIFTEYWNVVLYFLSLVIFCGKRREGKRREKDVLTNIQEHGQDKGDRLRIGVLDGRPILLSDLLF